MRFGKKNRLSGLYYECTVITTVLLTSVSSEKAAIDLHISYMEETVCSPCQCQECTLPQN